MLRIATLLDSLEEDDRRAVAYEVYRAYGGPLTDSERAQRYRDRARHEDVTPDSQPDPNVYVVPEAPGRKRQELQVTEETLEQARKLLDAKDLDFLLQCPEPYKTHWLSDPEWWVSLRDGYPKINALQQASRYMAWPDAKRKKDHRRALRNWFSTAERWRERDEQRKAVRG